jgi:trafficking protein particle complex subunit 10
MLEQAIDEALDEFPQYDAERSRLIAHMIQALESDANWVELYSITGELKVPASDDDAALKEVLTRIREVSYSTTKGVIAGT